MPTEQPTPSERDAIETIRGHLRSALTLIQASSRIADTAAPGLSGDLFALGAKVVHAIKALNEQQRAAA